MAAGEEEEEGGGRGEERREDREGGGQRDRARESPLRGAGRPFSWLPVLHRGYTVDMLAHASAPKIRVLA